MNLMSKLRSIQLFSLIASVQMVHCDTHVKRYVIEPLQALVKECIDKEIKGLQWMIDRAKGSPAGILYTELVPQEVSNKTEFLEKKCKKYCD